MYTTPNPTHILFYKPNIERTTRKSIILPFVTSFLIAIKNSYEITAPWIINAEMSIASYAEHSVAYIFSRICCNRLELKIYILLQVCNNSLSIFINKNLLLEATTSGSD